jgi:hypothetical protein
MPLIINGAENRKILSAIATSSAETLHELVHRDNLAAL